LKSRLDGLRETAETVQGLVRDVADHNPRGILLIASNPVDVLTYAAWKWSGLPASRVLATVRSPSCPRPASQEYLSKGFVSSWGCRTKRTR
jgi:hypothetical protein